MDNIPNVSVKRSVLQAAFENIKNQYRCGLRFSTLKGQEDAKEFPAIYYTLKDELTDSEDINLKTQSSLAYSGKRGGYLDPNYNNKVKYRVNCGAEPPLFMHYAVRALEGYKPELMLQWLYNSVIEEYIEKDKIHETLDGKVLVDKKALKNLLGDYFHLHAYKHKDDNMSGEFVISLPWSYIMLKEATRNDT